MKRWLLAAVAACLFACGRTRPQQPQVAAQAVLASPVSIADAQTVPRWQEPTAPLASLTEEQVASVIRETAATARAVTWLSNALATTDAVTKERVLAQIQSMSDQTVTMGLLERNAERFKDHLAVFSGEVLEIRENFTNDRLTFMRVWIDRRSATGIMAVFAVPGTVPDNVVTGSRVRVHGVLFRTYTYESQAHYSITIPRMDAIAVLRTGGR